MSEERLIKVGFFFDLILSPTNITYQSANYVRTELPVRIAHRIRDLQALPYVVVMQEGVANVYEVRYTTLRPDSTT